MGKKSFEDEGSHFQSRPCSDQGNAFQHPGIGQSEGLGDGSSHGVADDKNPRQPEGPQEATNLLGVPSNLLFPSPIGRTMTGKLDHDGIEPLLEEGLLIAPDELASTGPVNEK